jgi:hypothetical protein
MFAKMKGWDKLERTEFLLTHRPGSIWAVEFHNFMNMAQSLIGDLNLKRCDQVIAGEKEFSLVMNFRFFSLIAMWRLAAWQLKNGDNKSPVFFL